jgi:L-lactate dehydrogenase (cytochrome)
MSMRNILSLHDLEPAARSRLPRGIFGFVAGGAEDGHSLRANRDAFADYAFQPRVLINVASRDQSTSLFGRRYASPFGIAPMGAASLCRFEADLALARAACQAQVPFVLSAASTVPLERIAREAPGAWYQAYLPADRQQVERMLHRVAAAGYDVLVVTADVSLPGNREDNVRNGFGMPLRPSLQLALDGLMHPRWLAGTLARTLIRTGIPHYENYLAERSGRIIAPPVRGNYPGRDAFSWSELAWIRSRWKGHLVLKGVLHPADARRANAEGIDGIIVSNHGGRQLDGAVASLRALPGIIDAAGSSAVMLDGGVRRGTDVLKAMALGAKFVFVARPMLFAAAIAGETGVSHALQILRRELDRDLGLLGCTELSSVDRTLLKLAAEVAPSFGPAGEERALSDIQAVG